MAEEEGETKFETLEERTIDYGSRNFIEIARKQVTNEEGETSEFINISKGFYAPDESKRYRNSVGFPEDENNIKEFIVESLQEV